MGRFHVHVLFICTVMFPVIIFIMFTLKTYLSDLVLLFHHTMTILDRRENKLYSEALKEDMSLCLIRLKDRLV